MPMFLTLQEHTDYLRDCIKEHPTHILISTFGVYAGILYDSRDTYSWGPKYYLASRELLESMRHVDDVRILVGIAEYFSCNEKLPCEACERKYAKQLIRTLNHADHFPEFKWKMTTKLHLKSTLFFYKTGVKGVAGGRNFTDSNWDDCTFTLSVKDIKELYAYTNDIWENSLLINTAGIESILGSQKIPVKTLTNLTVGL